MAGHHISAPPSGQLEAPLSSRSHGQSAPPASSRRGIPSPQVRGVPCICGTFTRQAKEASEAEPPPWTTPPETLPPRVGHGPRRRAPRGPAPAPPSAGSRAQAAAEKRSREKEERRAMRMERAEAGLLLPPRPAALRPASRVARAALRAVAAASLVLVRLRVRRCKSALRAQERGHDKLTAYRMAASIQDATHGRGRPSRTPSTTQRRTSVRSRPRGSARRARTGGGVKRGGSQPPCVGARLLRAVGVGTLGLGSTRADS